MLRHLKLAAALLVILTCTIVGCDNSDSLKFKVELKTLQSELKTVQFELDALKKEVRNPQANSTTSKKAEQAISTINIKLDGSHKDDPFIGPKTAPVIVMAFTNYQCAPCRDFALNSFANLKNDFLDTNQVKFILRDFPLKSNKHSFAAAKLAHCAGEQGAYWSMHDYLFDNAELIDDGNFSSLQNGAPEVDTKRLASCFDSGRYQLEVQKDIAEGERLGAKGAPVFLIGKVSANDVVKGVFVRGAQPYPVLKEQIERQLKQVDYRPQG